MMEFTDVEEEIPESRYEAVPESSLARTVAYCGLAGIATMAFVFGLFLLIVAFEIRIPGLST